MSTQNTRNPSVPTQINLDATTTSNDIVTAMEQLNINPNTTPAPQRPTDEEESIADFDPISFAQSLGVVHDERHKTEDVIHDVSMTFKDFGLQLAVLKGIAAKGFISPSPVQVEAIPPIMMGQDILVRAKNGTGKTAAFSIPIINRINPKLNAIQALILVPSRELAIQTCDNVKEFAQYLSIKVHLSMGGNNSHTDVIALQQGPQIVVATPGRILDIATKLPKLLHQCTMFVMDEADKLLSTDFRPSAEYLIGRLHPQRNIMLFSATYPLNVKDFKDQFLPNAKLINTMDEITLKGVTQYYTLVEEKHKIKCLEALFKILKIDQVVIFCNSIKRTELLAKKIATDWNIPCHFIHSQMSQSDRTEVFHKFRKHAFTHLVSSDIFTRGIDVSTVNVVINFDFPTGPDTYLHRIGRAGRFGHLGIAINLITNEDRFDLYKIEQQLDTEITALPDHIDGDLYCK